jgi:hypothetical protein
MPRGKGEQGYVGDTDRKYPRQSKGLAEYAGQAIQDEIRAEIVDHMLGGRWTPSRVREVAKKYDLQSTKVRDLAVQARHLIAEMTDCDAESTKGDLLRAYWNCYEIASQRTAKIMIGKGDAKEPVWKPWADVKTMVQALDRIARLEGLVESRQSIEVHHSGVVGKLEGLDMRQLMYVRRYGELPPEDPQTLPPEKKAFLLGCSTEDLPEELEGEVVVTKGDKDA